MKKVILDKKKCIDAMYNKEEVRRRNFYSRHGKYFKFGSIKLTYDQWVASGGSVRRLMDIERMKRMEKLNKKEGGK